MSVMSRLRSAFTPPEQRSDMAWPSFGEWYGEMIRLNGQLLQVSQGVQTLHGKVEEADGDFLSLVQRAFMSNPVVFAAESRRLSAFSEIRFAYRNQRSKKTFGSTDLSVLEHPWAGAVTGDLLTRMLLYADFGGTGIALRSNATRGEIRVPRPDWCTLIMGSDRNPDDPAIEADAELIGVLYHPGGRGGGGTPEVFLPGEFSIFAPTPDPLAKFRGIPWPSVAAREIAGDSAMSYHKNLFMQNGATPNMVVTLDPAILQAEYESWVEEFKRSEPKGNKAFKTLYLGGGAKVDVVGVDFQKLDFKATQGAGETRIAIASGVPAVIIGASEGLAGSSLNAGNFSAARRLFADLTMRPLWRNVCGSLETILTVPGGAELWYDERDVAFLREDAKDRAEIWALQASANRTLVDAGWKPESIIAAQVAEDISLLEHSGLYSVQLQPPMPDGPPKAPTTEVIPQLTEGAA